MPPGRPSKVLRLPADLVDRLASTAEAEGVPVYDVIEGRCFPVEAVAGGAPPGESHAVVYRCVCPSPRPKVSSHAPICTGCRLPR